MRRIASAAIVALLAVAACAPPRPPPSRLVVTGHGFGHGIGISQYGALGYAQHGFDYREIIDHYYAQTAISSLPDDPDVRVLLQSGRRAVVHRRVAGGDRAPRPAPRPTACRARRGRLALRSRRPQARHLRRAAAPARGRRRRAAAQGPGRQRRARRPLPRRAGVPAERQRRHGHQRGRPRELPARRRRRREPGELAGRRAAGPGRRGPHLRGHDRRRQRRRRHRPVRGHALADVPRGAAEYPSTDAAIAATRGQVVTQNGTPVVTYFFSTSGGHTENVEFSFLGSLPRTWLKGVDDPFDDISPRHRGSRSRSPARRPCRG